MLGALDDQIVHVLQGTSLLMALGLSFVLGLRHATDPDHVVAVSTLLAGDQTAGRRRSTVLGIAWGAGHAITLTAFGIPIVLFGSVLPDVVQQAAEALIGALIVALAVRLLLRWRSGAYHVHRHAHEDAHEHVHVHSHADSADHRHGHEARGARRPGGSFCLGLAHGMGGSAGVGILLVAAIPDRAQALAALLVLSVGTAVSMAVLTTALGSLLTRPRVRVRLSSLIPVAGATSVAFGLWYAAAAYSLAPYPF